MENLEVIMEIIAHAGDARSKAMEAIQLANRNEFKKAKETMEIANNQLVEAHNNQTKLLQAEANGEDVKVTLLMIHAQDHLMNAMTVRDLATEIIKQYEVIHELKNQ